jgi:hypothetical protein
MKQKISKIAKTVSSKLKNITKVISSKFKNKKTSKIFNKLKNTNPLIKIGSVLLVFIIIIVLLNTLVFSRLEKVKINEVNEKIAYYIDEVVLYPEDDGRYINFAIEYLYNTTDKNRYSFDEVLEVINSTFQVDYTEKNLQDIGITIEMANKGIVIEGNNHEYVYNNSKTRADIANTPLVKFSPKRIKRISLNKYKVTYDKYVVENPYEILNYYDDLNLNNENKYDTTKIVEYLKGNEKAIVIKDAITSENITKIGKIDGTVSITFVVKNNKVLIKKIG